MIVADSNLVVALVVTHPQHDDAASLFALDADWHLPDWWGVELANALRNYHRSGQMVAGDAATALRNGGSLFPPENTHEVDLVNTLQIACDLDLSAYDARFIALARSLGQKLVTEDARLRKACPHDTLSIKEALALFS
jgi:predicted nucleic acid-binding protein